VSPSLAASKAKLFATEASIRGGEQLHPGARRLRVRRRVPGRQLLRDARVTTLYGDQPDQKLLIGRALTGVSAF
jgi:hypothetical protein